MSINIPTAYKTEIIFPFGKLDAMVTWCQNNCDNEWMFGDSEKGYTFYFESERDFVKFMIWMK